MERMLRWLSMVLVGLLVYEGRGAWAQQRMLLPTVTVVSGDAAKVAMPDASVGAALRNMASRAGLVFVGQVGKIERKGGVVEITFGVDQVVLGSAGATYTLREWGGLWVEGEQRYRVGQRVMVFLNAPSAAGLSSPVDGMEGIVPVVPMGANVAPLLDVRRPAARVQRLQGQPMRDEAIALPEAASVVAAWNTDVVAEPEKKLLPVGWKPAPVEMPGQMLAAGVSHAAR
jgi:hypothetical protein